MRWLSENYKWLFDGVAGAAAIALIVWLLQRLRHGNKLATIIESSVTKLAETVHAPTIHAQTVNYGTQSPLTPTTAPLAIPPKPKYEKVLPNVQFIGAETVSLREDFFYGQGLTESESIPNAILIRFANEPQRDKSNLTARVKSVLIYRFNGKEIDVVGSWLNEGSEVIDIEPDSRRHKLIVGMVIDGKFGVITGKDYIAHRRNWHISDSITLEGFEKGTVVVQLTDRSEVMYRSEFAVSLSPLTIAPKDEGAVPMPSLAENVRFDGSGPDVMIEYSYRERQEFPGQPTHNASAPLVLVNASPEHVAKNVRILPLAIGELNAKFEPDVLPYIEANGKREVKVVIDKIFPPLRHDLPQLFARAYKDTCTDELFSEVPHIFLVQYEDATHKRLFETSVTFLYQRFKNSIRVGETKRTLKQSI